VVRFEVPHYCKYTIECNSTNEFSSTTVMVGDDSMGRGLQLVVARFLNFLLTMLSRQLKLRRMSIFY